MPSLYFILILVIGYTISSYSKEDTSKYNNEDIDITPL